MIETVHVIGATGRVGSAVSARLAQRGTRIDAVDPDLVLLCVPDRAIPEVAADVAPGPWIAHVSGATPLSALDPHSKRFSLHPLLSITKARGAEQLDGGWAALTAETEAARATGRQLAALLGLRPFELRDEQRALYHAAAAFASNYVATLREIAGSLSSAAGAPRDALVPLIRSVIESDFELTGPIVRGDWETVERHLEAIRETRPELEELYLALAAETARLAGRDSRSYKLSLGVGGAS